MERNKALIEVLNDLVRINNDRIQGYDKAIRETKPDNTELMQVLDRMKMESDQIKEELESAIVDLGGEVADSSTTNSGKIYRTWMDLRTKLMGNSDHTILSLCEYGEDAAQKAYQHALESDATVDDIDIRMLIRKQKDTLKQAHDAIRDYRDAVKDSSH
ncbi:MAG: aldehyde dehydrogenase [Bacteroidetes bacterium]|nr:MAG: aldehyde dehydrogenase [Bacteroidota bacterium]